MSKNKVTIVFVTNIKIPLILIFYYDDLPSTTELGYNVMNWTEYFAPL